MHSAIYLGWLRHRRHAPRAHAFRYPLFMMYLDLAELDRVFAGRWLWSAKRAAPARFDRADHLGDPQRPLDTTVRDLVEARIGVRPAGPIRLLTHLRYFGHCFNPVSFYYCFGANGESVETVVAEVNNTPWGEQHCYVLQAKEGGLRFRFDKAFHVSPFMPMDLGYDWSFSAPGERLGVHMSLNKANARLFDATLLLHRRPATALGLATVLARFPDATRFLEGLHATRIPVNFLVDGQGKIIAKNLHGEALKGFVEQGMK